MKKERKTGSDKDVFSQYTMTVPCIAPDDIPAIKKEVEEHIKQYNEILKQKELGNLSILKSVHEPIEKKFELIFDKYKKTPHEDEGLRILVDRYLSIINQAQEAAENSFWQLAGELSEGDKPYFNKEQRDTLLAAGTGDFNAIVKLSRANPRTIHIPFVADGLISFLSDYAAGVKDNEKNKALKKKWVELLPSKRPLPYRGHELSVLYNMVRETGVTSDLAYELIGKALDISPSTVKGNVQIKVSKGRPSKK